MANIGITRDSYRVEGLAIDTYFSMSGEVAVDGTYEEGQVVALVSGTWVKYVPAAHDFSIDFTGETFVPAAPLGIIREEIDSTAGVNAAIIIAGKVRKSDVVDIDDDMVVRLWEANIYAQ